MADSGVFQTSPTVDQIGDVAGRLRSERYGSSALLFPEDGLDPDLDALLAGCLLFDPVAADDRNTVAFQLQTAGRNAGGPIRERLDSLEALLRDSRGATGLILRKIPLEVLQRARAISRQTTKSEGIGTSHLVTAVFMEIGVESLSRLSRHGLDFLGFLRGMVSRLDPKFENVDAWRRVLQPLLGRSARPRFLPAYSPESTHGEDRLGVATDAEVFARLICYRKASPPLSIGLFGEWGAGKSFFMELICKRVAALTNERIRRRIETEARIETGEKPAPGTTRRTDPFVTSVMQLKFNAWSYADADIWASLTAEIFDQIRVGGFDGREGAIFGRLLDLVAKDIQATEGKLTESLAKEEASTTEASRFEKEIALLTTEAARLESKAFVDIAGETVKELLKKPGKDDPDNDVRSRLDKAGKAIGYDKLSDEVLALQVQAEKAASFGGTALLMWRTLANGGWFSRVFFIGLGLLITIALAAPAFDLVAGWVPVAAKIAAAFPAVAAVLGSVVAAWTRIAPLVDFSDRYMKRLKKKQEENAAKLGKVKSDLAEARAKAADAKAAAQAATGRLRLLPGSKTADAKATLLRYFLFETEDTRDFEANLGIVSRARRAFETLNSILGEYRAFNDLRDRKTDGETLPRKDQARLEALSEKYTKVVEEERNSRKVWWEKHKADPIGAGEPPRSDIPDRIVLYIDDLDRCRTDQVVKVLEAVHLLLAFDSFVAVVGVDARWIRAALASHYEGQFADSAKAGSHRASALGPTPDDYLEKIFQIPFWLRSISIDPASESLSTLLDEVAGKPLSDDEPEGELEYAPSGLDHLVLDGSPNLANGVAPPPESLGSAPDIVEEERELAFFSRERQLFEELGPLISRSPRTVKRFINSYRIIRDHHRDNLNAFVSAEVNAPYAAVAFLLAIEVGLSRAERDLCIDAIFGEDVKMTVGMLSDWLSDPNEGQTHADQGLPWSWRDKVSVAASRIQTLGIEFDTSDLARYQPLVGRLSFHGPNRT